MQEEESTFLLIQQHLSGIQYQLTEHEPVLTSEQAAQIRGVSLESGAKAMLLNEGGALILAVLSATRKINWKAIKRVRGVRNIRFATEEEVWNVTHCLPGAVPPFGSIFNIQTYMDESLRQQGDTINFNAGLRTKSISMTL